MAERSRWVFWAGVAFCSAVFIGTVIGVWWLVHTLSDAQEVPLRRLAVQGAEQTVTAAEVREALRSDALGSFFSADVNELRQRVEQLPWVERASVRKEWPDVLQVYVVEQQPLAFWNDDRMLNLAGEVFKADSTRLSEAQRQQLPYLYGPEDAKQETLDQFRALSALLQINGFRVQALRLSPRFATEVVLADGTELRLGRESQLQRVQRFIDVYPAIEKQQDRPIDYVDLRYDTGVSVRWQDEQ